MKKPIIGIVPLYDEFKKSYWMLPGYMQVLEKCGAIPVMLPLTDNKENIELLADYLDGFLFSGGHDINPNMYNQEKIKECHNICLKRDNMEKILFKEILKRDKPIFGICRGIQMINVLLGGDLYQDLKTQKNIVHTQTPPYDISFHSVKILKDTPLYSLLKEDKIQVNSYHHQAIKNLSDKLVPMAISDDDIIEAVYMKEKNFIWAVQWHPEFNFKKEETSIKIISEFIKNCK